MLVDLRALMLNISMAKQEFDYIVQILVDLHSHDSCNTGSQRGSCVHMIFRYVEELVLS